MISINDIKSREILSVNVEGQEEYVFAKVLSVDISNNQIFITYLTELDEFTDEGYGLYEFDDFVSTIEPECIVAHYNDVIDIGELNFINVGKNLYVDKNEIEEDNDSDSSSLDGFIVDDCDEEEGDYERDPSWDNWHPTDERGKSFKEMIDRMEARARFELDEKKFQ